MNHIAHPAPASENADQEAMLAILQDARRRLEAHRKQRDETIAIVGMAGRFPGADDIDAFWRMLRSGESGLRPVSDEELENTGVSREEFSKPDYVKVWGSFENPAGFDAAFFGYSPRDAELLDPQQRVFLECAWSALEHAGYDSRAWPGRIGVYAGGSLNDNFNAIRRHPALRDSIDPIQAGLGNVNGMIASRVAYHLDLRGPGVGVQATCATSLVAVHLAARSLLAGECDMALAGGVAVGQPLPEGYIYKNEGIGSPDGLCRPFDAAAQGTVFTNGVGAVVLKRLSDAQADGDTILAVIRGSAIGNDGAARVGLTAPGVAGQTAVLEAALSAARIAPSDIDYVEAHGTATILGDPVELTSLNRVYGEALTAAGRQCALGSVKSNLGHMDAAAGIGGLMKIVLAMRNDYLPASINFSVPNPACNFETGPFRVLHEGRLWPASAERPRRAAISSFGMGGANAHLIVEEAPQQTDTPQEDEAAQLLCLSARTPAALDAMKAALANAIGADQPASLADIAYTLRVGRVPMDHRFAFVASTKQEAASLLTSGDAAGISGEPLSGEPQPVFMFPGQGAQYPGMARELHERDSTFRAAFDECVALMPENIDLRGALYGGAGDAAALDRTEVTQPALFAVEYALARMWLQKGLRPRAFIGHSIGEYVAACLAGVFSLADAVRLVCARGRLMQACQPGAMLSVMLSETEARTALQPGVEIAAVNGPRNCVLAGTHEAIEKLAADFDRRGLPGRLLRTSHAFHSFMMEPALAEFSAVLNSVTLNAPSVDIVSNVTGEWLTASQATDPAYWTEHLRKPVLFGPGLARALEIPDAVLLEVGPGVALSRLARQQLPANGHAIASLAEATNPGDAAEHVLRALGELWVAGVDIRKTEFNDGRKARRVGLPTYPFQRHSYLIRPVADAVSSPAPSTQRSGDIADWFYYPGWKRQANIAPLAGGDSRRKWLILNARAVMALIGTVPDGVDFVTVEAGEAFAETGSGYALAPAETGQYQALFEKLIADGGVPERIVNGFSLDPELAFRSTLALGRALAETGTAGIHLSVLTRGAQRITGSEDIDADAAMATGVTRVLQQELPELRCQIVDLPVQNSDVAAQGLRNLLLQPWSADTIESGLRGGHLWTRDYPASRIDEAESVPVLKEDATWLIAGDLVDGPALSCVSAIVRSLRGRAILAGRKGLPPAEEWERWLASHSPQHPVSQFIRALRDIGTPGRDYRLFSGDIADAQWLRTIIAEGEREFGPVHGVFHTAGMGDLYHCPLQQATPESHEGLFATKIAGIRALADALNGSRAAFVLVQSSLSTIVGGSGLAAYSAANGFLDAFVEARQGAKGATWQCINWDACAPYTQKEAGAGLFADAITPEEFWRVARTILSQPDVTRIVVTPGNLAARLDVANRPATAENVERPASHADGRQSVRAAYIAPRDPLEAAVASIMGELLGIERVGVDDNFFELGGHSLLAIQVVTRLRKQFDVDLPMRALLFEAPTAAGIAAVIREPVETARRERETLAALLDDIETAVAPK